MNPHVAKIRKPFFILFFIAAIIALVYVTYFIYLIPHNVITPNSNNTIVVSNQDQTGPGLPVRLIIPSIQVDAPIIGVGLAPDGSIGVPKGPSDVAWFKLGPRPGQNGSSILAGHFGPWRSGAHSVFDNLDKLKAGDKVYIKDDKGNTISFLVQKSRIYKASESPKELFNRNDNAYLNLITCNGDWIASQKTYTDRLVVFTQLEKQ